MEVTDEIRLYDEVEFAGMRWIVLDPKLMYVVLKESVKKGYFDRDGKNVFDPSMDGNIGNYLNLNFLRGINDEDTKAIRYVDWGVSGTLIKDDTNGRDSNLARYIADERRVTGRARVGTLTVSDWKRHFKGLGEGVLQPEEGMTWLITPCKGTDMFVMVVSEEGEVSPYYSTEHCLLNIRPTLFLDKSKLGI